MLDKKVIVTGASYGMGADLVTELARQGATVAAMARSVELGEKRAAEATALGSGQVRFYRCDVSDRTQVHDSFATAVADMGGLDALVHVAAVETGARAEEETDEEWERIFKINAQGTFITNQEAFPYLKEKGGRIINFGSGAANSGMADGPAYAASKGAVSSWTRAAANSWGKYGITANLILPAIWTPMYDAHRARYTPEELQIHEAAMARQIKIGGKLGDASRDLAPVILFLLSDGSGFLTGQSISVDGGGQMMR